MAAIIKTPVLIRLKCMYSCAVERGEGSTVLGTLRTPNRQWRYRFGKVPLGVKLQTELMTRQRWWQCRRLQSWQRAARTTLSWTILSRKSCPRCLPLYSKYSATTNMPKHDHQHLSFECLRQRERESPLPNPLGLTRAMSAPASCTLPLPRPAAFGIPVNVWQWALHCILLFLEFLSCLASASTSASNEVHSSGGNPFFLLHLNSRWHPQPRHILLLSSFADISFNHD